MSFPRPLIVVEASAKAFAHAVREVERTGARVVYGWRNETGIVCAGVIADASDASAALVAAVWGAGLVVHARAVREVIDRLVDDLRRLGTVDHRLEEPDFGRMLSNDEEQLLALLGEGMTVGEAATQLHISRRTADRRLAAARRKLDVATTAEAVVALHRRPPVTPSDQ